MSKKNKLPRLSNKVISHNGYYQYNYKGTSLNEIITQAIDKQVINTC